MLLKYAFPTLLIGFLYLSSCGDSENPEPGTTITISTENTEINEGNISVNFTVTSSQINDSGEDVLITYQTSGSSTSDVDYTGADGSVVMQPNSQTTQITITLLDDEESEENETVTIQLTGVNNEEFIISDSNSASITIIDNDQTNIECPNDNSISTVNIGCDTNPSVTSMYNEQLENNKRIIAVNTYPNHQYTTKEPLSPLNRTFEMSTTPTVASAVSSVISDTGRPVRYFGVALNGVLIAPAPATPFIFENTQTGEYNWDWVFEPNNNQGDGRGLVALDCASAHVGPQGYHYHGNMVEYVETIQSGLSSGTIPDKPVQIGWASDGFPIIYLYGPDESGNLIKLQPGFQLKEGDRPGDGVSAPCGSYSGKYTNDYEFVSGIGDLDECNGINRDITLTTIDGEKVFTYFYLITESFPQIGRCLAGTPDDSFNN